MKINTADPVINLIPVDEYSMRTKAQNHRLILSHVYLVPMLASAYRGARGIPFDELEGAGMVGLVQAAAGWEEKSDFAEYANASIRNEIKKFIRDYSAPPDSEMMETGETTPEFYIWQSWSDREFIFAISERWENVATSPEAITVAFDEVRNARAALTAAMIGFSRRERDIMNARFFSKPFATIDSIARQHKLSYARVIFLIERMIKKIREIIKSREAAIPPAMRRVVR